MRVVLDTNILVSALLVLLGHPEAIYRPWEEGYFTLLVCAQIGSLPCVERSPDPTDDFLLALSEAGKADYLVTGDKSGLLALARHKATRIMSASAFVALFA